MTRQENKSDLFRQCEQKDEPSGERTKRKQSGAYNTIVGKAEEWAAKVETNGRLRRDSMHRKSGVGRMMHRDSRAPGGGKEE